MNPKELIKNINASCRKSISSAFNLSLCDRNRNANWIHYILEGTSSAVNKQDTVRVLNWFDDFWLFFEIKFFLSKKRNVKDNIQIIISLSVFQGNDSDSEKYQLFRGEWDDYNTSDEKHAQPHWHISSRQEIDTTFNEFGDGFGDQVFKREKLKMIDVKRIHFAMNADWQSNGKHVHTMENEQQVVDWLQGMLAYIRNELENI